jgi:4-alpha-glucanotransferase
VLEELKILNLHVQRMPKSFDMTFEDPRDFPESCVCTPSNHDTAPLRAWWEEDPEASALYYHVILKRTGEAPQELTGALATQIVQAHLDSKAKYALFLLQDLLATSEALRFPDPSYERINDPAIAEYAWNWRMHLYVEELLLAKSFTRKIRAMIEEARR